MDALTLDRVLTDAEHLSAEEREILEDLLHKRRIEEWRRETAAAFRSGKLKAQSVENIIARLRSGKP